MQTQSTACFKHAGRYFRQIRVVFRDQMEAEYVFSGVDINSMLLQHEIVACIESFATCNIDLFKVQTDYHKSPESLASDVRAADIELIQIGEVGYQLRYALIFEIGTS